MTLEGQKKDKMGAGGRKWDSCTETRIPRQADSKTRQNDNEIRI